MAEKLHATTIAEALEDNCEGQVLDMEGGTGTADEDDVDDVGETDSGPPYSNSNCRPLDKKLSSPALSFELSRTNSMVEHDAPSPTLNPLILASLVNASREFDSTPLELNSTVNSNEPVVGDRSIHSNNSAFRFDTNQKESSGNRKLQGLANLNLTIIEGNGVGGSDIRSSPSSTRRAVILKPVGRPNSEIARPTKLPILVSSSSSPSSPGSPYHRSPSSPSSGKFNYRHSMPSSPSKIPVKSPSCESKSTSPFVFPSSAGAAGRRIGKVRSQTLQFKEKFVTELTMYVPFALPIPHSNKASTECDGANQSSLIRNKLSSPSKPSDEDGPPEESTGSKPDAISSSSGNSPSTNESIENTVDTTAASSEQPSNGSEVPTIRPGAAERRTNTSTRTVRRNSAVTAKSEPVGRKQVSLGVYIATDRCHGAHSIYKISPIATLLPMKFRVGDRITCVNDLSVESWSHTCLVEFIRSLSLNCIPQKMEVGNRKLATMFYSTTFAVTLRRVNRQARTPDSLATEDRVEATLTMDSSTGVRVSSVRETELRVRHVASVGQVMRNYGSGHYLHMEAAVNDTRPAALRLGPSHETGPTATDCVTVHTYTVPPNSNVGQLVVIESSSRGLFLSPVSAAQGAALGVTESSSSPATLTNVDARFFRMADSGGMRIALIHHQTGMYVSHSNGTLRLMNPTPANINSDDTFFEMFPCVE